MKLCDFDLNDEKITQVNVFKKFHINSAQSFNALNVVFEKRKLL